MKLISVAAVTLATASAFAAPTTEYFFQPNGGQSALELNYMMGNDPVKFEGGGESKTTTNDLMLDYSYGLSDNAAVGGYITTGSQKVSSGGADSTASGMGDLHAYYRGFSDMIRYGVDLGISLAKQKYNSTGELTNRASGGMSLAAYVGLLTSADAWNYGGNLSVGMPLERSYEVDGGGGGKIKGGMLTRLAGFGEYNYGMGFVGAELAYNMVGDTTQTPDGGGDTKLKGENYLSLGLNASYNFNDMATGLIGYSMGMHGARDYDDTGATKVEAYTSSMINIGARFTF